MNFEDLNLQARSRWAMGATKTNWITNFNLRQSPFVLYFGSSSDKKMIEAMQDYLSSPEKELIDQGTD